MNIEEEIRELLHAEIKRFDSSVIRRPHLLAVLAIRFYNDYATADFARKISRAIAGMNPHSDSIRVSSRVAPFLERCKDEDSIKDVYVDLQKSFISENRDTKDEEVGEENPQETFDEVMDELEKLIGLRNVKNQIERVTAMHKVNMQRIGAGLVPIEVTNHLVFTGDPGTGKTTVARIVARLFRSIGILPQGQFVEVQRADLVGGYIGQTAIKTQEVIDRAIGGVLFIDEAYSLTPKDTHGNDFGKEAIATLLKAMEDHRGGFTVIVAGYTQDMKRFVDSNPGLKSRFSTVIEFENYSSGELIQVFEKLCSENAMTFDSQVTIQLRSHLDNTDTSGTVGNARYVRSIFESMFANLAVRVSKSGEIAELSLTHFKIEDLPDFNDDKTRESLTRKFGFTP